MKDYYHMDVKQVIDLFRHGSVVGLNPQEKAMVLKAMSSYLHTMKRIGSENDMSAIEHFMDRIESKILYSDLTPSGSLKERENNLEKMTNSDRIRQMTDEQLAEFLASLMPQSCDSCRLMEPDFIPMFYCMGKYCETAWIDWLKDYDRHFWKGREPLKDDGNNLEKRTVDDHSKRFQARGFKRND